MTTDTTTSSPLKHRDVEIGMIDPNGFLITTTPEKYQVVRNCLTIWSEQQGLPVEYSSEMEGMKISMLFKAMRQPQPDFITQDTPDSIPRIDNHFVIPGHKKVGSNIIKMRALAEQVAKQLRAFELEVEVNEESSLRPKIDSETEFVYTILVTSIAIEIAKLGKDHPIWEDVPAIIRIMLLTGEFEALKEMIAHTPPVLEIVSDLFADYTEQVKAAIDKCENFKQDYDPDHSKEGIAKLELTPPTKEIMKMLEIMRDHHKQ